MGGQEVPFGVCTPGAGTMVNNVHMLYACPHGQPLRPLRHPHDTRHRLNSAAITGI